mmetsp:Transcript_11555/g.20993  ORF Transcript_11555/g.20993 Transcript_11555/m.20993 type:complete len:168 (+) Transcript_11555:93-596(+)
MTEVEYHSGVREEEGGAAPTDKNDELKKSTNDVTEHPSSCSSDDEIVSIQELEKDAALFQFLTGMKEDLQARAPLYKSDWGRPQSIYTVVNATCFAFVIQLIPALIFAELMNRETQSNLATAETLLSSAIIGIIYAIFSGQVRAECFIFCHVLCKSICPSVLFSLLY